MRENVVGEFGEAVGVVLAPVVAVGELERVNVPLARRELPGDNLFAGDVGAADPRAAALAGAVKRVLVDLVGDGVVDDVAALQAPVLGFEPSVDPERLGADDLLLLVGHGAGDVHHVNHRRVRLRLGSGRPAAVLLVVADGDDDGVPRVELPAGDAALQRPLVGAFDVAEAVRPRPADAIIAVLAGRDCVLPLRFDAGQFEGLAEHRGQFVQRDLDLADVPARLVAGGPGAVAVAGPAAAADRLALFALPLPDAAAAAFAVPEVRDLDVRHRDGNCLPPLPPEHFALGHIFLQVAADLPADDLLESLRITVDGAGHRSSLPVGL